MAGPRVLINALSVARTGGSRSYVLNLLRELGRDGRGFSFAVLAARGALAPHELHGLPLLEAALPGRPAAARTPARIAYEQLVLPRRARGFDALFCPADVAPARGRTPTVVALRNLNIYDRRFYDTPRTRLLLRLVRLGVRRPGVRAFTPTRAAAQAIGPQLGLAPETIGVIPHGIAPEAFEATAAAAPTAAPAAAAEAGKPYLFLASNLERHKNIEAVFAALTRLDPAIHFRIAGGRDLDPAWAAQLEALAGRLGVAERVHFLGSVPYAQVLAHYRGALALVFPTRLETFGHPLLEAMLAGTPIVCSDLPALREVAGPAADYVDPGDAEALARAVARVAGGDPAAAQRVALGRERVRDFSWARAVDALCATLEAAIAR